MLMPRDTAPTTPTMTTLDNGLRVMTTPMPGAQTVSLGLFVDAGARSEQESESGAAHFIEHMLFKGTETRTARAIAEEIEAVGGQMNAYTGREQTAFYTKVLPEDSALAFDILSDMMLRPRFDPDDVELERDVILQEIAQVEDTPDDIVFDLLQAAAYPDQALGRPILGAEDSLRGLDGQRLGQFMETHYSAGQLIVSAAGAITHDQLVELADRHLGQMPNRPNGGFEAARYTGGITVDGDADQCHLAFALPAPAAREDSVEAAAIAATLLGGGMSSWLFQEIREQRGLAYSVFCNHAAWRDHGLFTVYMGTAPDRMAEAVDVSLDILQSLAERPTGIEEINRAKAQLRAGMIMGLESTATRADQQAIFLLTQGHLPEVNDLLARIDAVTPDQVSAIMTRALLGHRPTVALVGPGEVPERLQRPLLALQ